MGKDNWTPYRAYLLSDLKSSSPLKRSQTPQTAPLGTRGLRHAVLKRKDEPNMIDSFIIAGWIKIMMNSVSVHSDLDSS
ncbi:hypothetical protein AVEN_196461-1 [Araneus ventricosus]|uniref:Uncharacterized protein n=1 Tax=Araneus ventricosus TaxID=182803 RepID=A0A4Y2AWU4_ARAVE|nr:hypothetical protein AVEN_196461-1 [Araneus ventricosus]